jgi:hypothetical protein
VEPEKPIVETTPAAHIAAIVNRRMRRGVSQGMLWLCIHVLKPLAAEAAAIAHPAHMSAKRSGHGGSRTPFPERRPARLRAR